MNRKLPGMKSNSTVVRVPRFKRQGNEEQFEIRTAKRVPVPKFSKKRKIKILIISISGELSYHCSWLLALRPTFALLRRKR